MNTFATVALASSIALAGCGETPPSRDDTHLLFGKNGLPARIEYTGNQVRLILCSESRRELNRVEEDAPGTTQICVSNLFDSRAPRAWVAKTPAEYVVKLEKTGSPEIEGIYHFPLAAATDGKHTVEKTY